MLIKIELLYNEREDYSTKRNNPREVPCLIHEEKKRKRDGEIPRLALKLRRIQGGETTLVLE